MESQTEDVIKQLNRLLNDRSLPPQARNKIRDAIQHIRELELNLTKTKGDAVRHLYGLKSKLAKLEGENFA